MVAEMATGQPLFPGDSDVEQLALILACLGPLCKRHARLVASTPAIAGAWPAGDLDSPFPSHACLCCLHVFCHCRCTTCRYLAKTQLEVWSYTSDVLATNVTGDLTCPGSHCMRSHQGQGPSHRRRRAEPTRTCCGAIIQTPLALARLQAWWRRQPDAA